MNRPTPLTKQHDAAFQLLNDDGTTEPIQVPKTPAQQHAERALRQRDSGPFRR